MFETLSDRLTQSLGKLTRKGNLTEQDVDDAMREVRRALLEADVNFKVAKDFIAAVRERAVGQDVLELVVVVDECALVGDLGRQLHHLAVDTLVEVAFQKRRVEVAVPVRVESVRVVVGCRGEEIDRDRLTAARNQLVDLEFFDLQSVDAIGRLHHQPDAFPFGHLDRRRVERVALRSHFDDAGCAGRIASALGCCGGVLPG